MPEGEHEIRLVFFPAGLKTGLILTGCGVLMFALMLVYLWFIKRFRVFADAADEQPEDARHAADVLPEDNARPAADVLPADDENNAPAE